jgi:hypothetical protein
MRVSFQDALVVRDQAMSLFDKDPLVRSVGITIQGDSHALRIVRAVGTVPFLAARAVRGPQELERVPLVWVDRDMDISPLVRLPGRGPGSPSVESVVPEQGRRRPLVCGLQIENWDEDHRSEDIPLGFILVCTLGCFVRTASGRVAALSNGHTLAGLNRAVRGRDRVLQPGGLAYAGAEQIGRLTNYVGLEPSPRGTTPAMDVARLNVLDAAVIELDPDVKYTQAFLPARGLPPPTGTARPAVGERVYKVGRTTGLTRGVVADVDTVMGPLNYEVGECWFQRSFSVTGIEGTMFADRGDSGAAVLREATGEVLGLVYAGNGYDTYVCPIHEVLQALGGVLV